MASDQKDEYLPVSQLRQYELIKLIGRGTRSAMYVARDESTDRRVAIKLLNRDLVADPKAVWRFFSRAVAAARLQHPFVAQTFYVGHDTQYYFCAREFVDGDSLGGRLAEGQNFSTDELLDATCQILEAVAAAHARGIEHGNLHAENVLFDRVQERLVLTDFHGCEPTSAASDSSINVKRDMRDVGSLVQQMLMGFDATSAFSARSKSITSADLSKFIERLMSKGTAPPFQSAVEALLTAKRLAGDAPAISAPEVGAADNLLQHQVAAARTNLSTVFELPVLEEVRDLPDDLPAGDSGSRTRSWWRWFGSRASDDDDDGNRLQETYTSVKETLAELQRRRLWLNRFATAEQEILKLLQQPKGKTLPHHATSIERQQRLLVDVEHRATKLNEMIGQVQQQSETLDTLLKLAR